MELEVIMHLFVSQKIDIPEVGYLYKKNTETPTVLIKQKKSFSLDDICLEDKEKIIHYFNELDVTPQLLYSYILGCKYDYKKHAKKIKEYLNANDITLNIFDKELYLIVLFNHVVNRIRNDMLKYNNNIEGIKIDDFFNKGTN